MSESTKSGMNRRQFVQRSAMVGAGAWVVPSVISLTATAASASTVGAAISAGNPPPVERGSVDTYQNFVIFDDQNPVSGNGTITSIQYFASSNRAATAGDIRFIFASPQAGGTYLIEYVSAAITPGAAGAKVFTPPGGVAVQAGWLLGVYSAGTGVVPFDYSGGNPDPYTNDNTGLPGVGTTVTAAGASSRIYSMSATGHA